MVRSANVDLLYILVQLEQAIHKHHIAFSQYCLCIELLRVCWMGVFIWIRWIKTQTVWFLLFRKNLKANHGFICIVVNKTVLSEYKDSEKSILLFHLPQVDLIVLLTAVPAFSKAW